MIKSNVFRSKKLIKGTRQALVALCFDFASHTPSVCSGSQRISIFHRWSLGFSDVEWHLRQRCVASKGEGVQRGWGKSLVRRRWALEAITYVLASAWPGTHWYCSGRRGSFSDSLWQIMVMDGYGCSSGWLKRITPPQDEGDAMRGWLHVL